MANIAQDPYNKDRPKLHGVEEERKVEARVLFPGKIMISTHGMRLLSDNDSCFLV